MGVEAHQDDQGNEVIVVAFRPLVLPIEEFMALLVEADGFSLSVVTKKR